MLDDRPVVDERRGQGADVLAFVVLAHPGGEPAHQAAGLAVHDLALDHRVGGDGRGHHADHARGEGAVGVHQQQIASPRRLGARVVGGAEVARVGYLGDGQRPGVLAQHAADLVGGAVERQHYLHVLVDGVDAVQDAQVVAERDDHAGARQHPFGALLVGRGLAGGHACAPVSGTPCSSLRST